MPIPDNELIPARWTGNADPSAGSLWASYVPAQVRAPMFVPQPRDAYGNPTQPAPMPYGVGGAPISQRIQGLVNEFTSGGPQMQQPGMQGWLGNGQRTPQSGYVHSMNWNGAGRPVGSTVASPRSQQVATGVADAFRTNQGTNQVVQRSLADWTKEFEASRQPRAQFAGEESAAVGRLYGTGADSTGGQLARIRQNARLALRDQTQAAMRRAGMANNLRRLGAGGVGSSYLDRVYAQDMAGIASQGAMRDADQERQDLMYLQGQQLGQVGTRQDMMDRLLQGQLMPAQVNSGLQTDQMGRLGQLASLEYGNNTYQPAEDAYGRRINYLNDLINMGYQV